MTNLVHLQILLRFYKDSTWKPIVLSPHCTEGCTIKGPKKSKGVCGLSDHMNTRLRHAKTFFESGNQNSEPGGNNGGHTTWPLLEIRFFPQTGRIETIFNWKEANLCSHLALNLRPWAIRAKCKKKAMKTKRPTPPTQKNKSILTRTNGTKDSCETRGDH